MSYFLKMPTWSVLQDPGKISLPSLVPVELAVVCWISRPCGHRQDEQGGEVLLEAKDSGVVVVERMVPPHGRVDGQDGAVDLHIKKL